MKHKHVPLVFALAAASLPAIDYAAPAAEEATPPSMVAPEATSNTPPETAPNVAENEDGMKMFRFTLRMDKIDFVKKTMELDPEQEQKFMTQYDHYDTELNKLNDERMALIKDYAAKFENIKDKDADKLAKRALNLRKQRLALLEKYYGKIAKATSKATAARFLQVESILQGAGDVAVGSSLPLMPE
ncbi:MAG: hypothetical protein ACU837_11775 [Gammaproteobacteria bacterium]